MRREKLVNITAALLLTLTLTTSAAFAVEGAAPAADGEMAITEAGEQEKTAQNHLITGPVETVTENEDGTVTIFVKNDESGTIFHIQKGSFVINQITGQLAEVADIEEGMTVTAVVPNTGIMALSLPPQIPGAIGFVINSEMGSVDVSVYNDSLVNETNDLKLNISEDTYIIHENGVRKVFLEEDLKGKELVVLYGVTTRSIPAQTSPDVIMILTSEADIPIDTRDSDAYLVQLLDTYVPLRNAAEEKGYEVIWNGLNAPIELVKDGQTIVVTLGDINATIKDAEGETALDLGLVPKLENAVTYVPQSFIEVL